MRPGETENSMKVTTSMCGWRTAYLCRLASTGTASTHPGVRMASPIFPGRRSSQASPLTTNSRPCRRAHASHFGLQEQDLLAAPLIVRETSAIKSGMQEIVIFSRRFVLDQLADAVPTICASRNPVAWT
jgi:hypothetical protein